MYAATDNCAAAAGRRLRSVPSAYVHSALKRCTTREKKTERQIDRHVFNSVTVRSVHPAFPVSLQFDGER